MWFPDVLDFSMDSIVELRPWRVVVLLLCESPADGRHPVLSFGSGVFPSFGKEHSESAFDARKTAIEFMFSTYERFLAAMIGVSA